MSRSSTLKKQTNQLRFADFNFIKIIIQVQENWELTEPPDEGVYIKGLFMEGARWNADLMCVDESFPKILYDDFPPVM